LIFNTDFDGFKRITTEKAKTLSVVLLVYPVILMAGLNLV